MLTLLFDGIAYGSLLFIISIGLSVTMGLMNFVNLAHGAFAMLGGYACVMLMTRAGVPFLVTLPAAFVVAAAAGIVLNAAVLAALLAVQWAPTFLRKGVYPFLGNAMFSSSLRPGTVIAAEVRIVVRTSDGAEREIAAPDAIAVHGITFTAIGFAPEATIFRPARTIDWARTVAVVVPSPAMSLVLEATSFKS